MNRRVVVAAAAFFVSIVFVSAQETVVSKKQDVAVFALGFHGYDIPVETLATVDAEIQGVFVNLGRFNVLGQTERFSATDVAAFTEAIREAKRSNTTLPDEVKFGDVQLTEALVNKLYGAFVVVIPTVTDYNSAFNKSQNQWETDIRTSVSFLNVAEGTTLAMVNIRTSGTSKETKYKSVQSAVDGIASFMTFEVRKIPAFTINTRVLQVRGGEVKMQLGTDMGVVVGDEYVIVEKTELAGLVDEREDGLLIIKNVGPQISTGSVVYAGKTLAEGAQLREVPRLGLDFEPYLRYLTYFEETNGNTTAAIVGAKILATRGFYSLKPMAGVQMNFDSELWIPVAGYAGIQYDLHIRRLTLSASGAFGGATNVVFKMLEDAVEDATDTADDETYLSHYGVLGSLGASWLVSRDMRVFAEAGAEYWLSLGDSNSGPFSSYGGTGISVGVGFKL